jgi:hypothetical protein
VTLRDRDSAAQSRVSAGEDLDRLLEALADLRAGRQTVAAIKEELGLETVAGDEDPIDAGAE